MPIHYGDIIEGEILDPNDGNKKPRPLLVISFDHEIATGEPLLVLAISSSHIPDPLPEDYFWIPYQKSRHPVTGLTKPCVVKCSWIRTLPQSDVLQKKGRATDKVLYQVTQYLAKHPPKRVSEGD